jgi:hypothetical protein
MVKNMNYMLIIAIFIIVGLSIGLFVVLTNPKNPFNPPEQGVTTTVTTTSTSSTTTTRSNQSPITTTTTTSNPLINPSGNRENPPNPPT